MSLYKIQGKTEKRKGIYYEFDSGDEPLGEGGMGKVYKGRCIDEATGMARSVAVKFMYSDLPPYAIEKARREAAIHFRHDNLIEMLGFIETESKSVLGETQHHYHVVSELLEGVSLDHLFEGKLTDQKGNYVPFAEKMFKDYQQDVNHFSVEIIKNILSGLMTMHDAGYIHRDIDPTNIMITSDGRIKLIDFGIAKKMNALTTHDKHLTQAGQFVGKPEYAAPELVLGAIDEQNQTTDIYAVGILLFQCIVGHVPFEGDRNDILQKQLHSSLPLKLIKHKGLREIIRTATEKSRTKRFQSAAEFRVALEKLDLNASGSGSSILPVVWRATGIVAACLLVGVVGWKVVTIYSGGGITPPPPPPPSVEMDYNRAVSYLHSAQKASEGMDGLQQLSKEGNSDATFLLFRLYFKSNKEAEDDFCPDSIKVFKANLNISADNYKAHDLLQTCVKQNPNDYHALYELASDYWKSEQRTDVVPERDGDKAEYYYRQALKYAEEAKDTRYVARINSRLEDFDKWQANMQKSQKRRKK